MQIANVLLSLGGDHGNQIMKFHVTAAEIAVLRGIHGDESVTEVEPQGDVKRSHREERGRLLSIYGMAKSDEQKPIVEGMFPGVAARVFETLAELDLDESYFKATGRMTAPASSGQDEQAAADEPEAPAHDADEDDTVGDDMTDAHAEKDILG